MSLSRELAERTGQTPAGLPSLVELVEGIEGEVSGLIMVAQQHGLARSSGNIGGHRTRELAMALTELQSARMWLQAYGVEVGTHLFIDKHLFKETQRDPN